MLPPAHGGAPDRLMILLHGYGADGNDLIGLGRHWAGLLPGALFVSPNAPQPCGQSPMGYEWFPLQLDRTLSRVTGAAAARPALQAFLEPEQAVGNPPAPTDELRSDLRRRCRSFSSSIETTLPGWCWVLRCWPTTRQTSRSDAR